MKVQITISGMIGLDVKPADIRRQLDAAVGADVVVEVSSPGGLVFDGVEIFNAFRDYKRRYPGARMTCIIRGIAASMASYLVVNPAFDHVETEDNAVLMIHNVHGNGSGDHNELRKTADVFEGLCALLANAYAARTGKTVEEIREMMDAETWFFGAEIAQAGFADSIIPGTTQTNKASALANARTRFSGIAAALSGESFEKIAAAVKPIPGGVLGWDASGTPVTVADVRAHGVEVYAGIKTFTESGKVSCDLAKSMYPEAFVGRDYFGRPVDGVIRNERDFRAVLNVERQYAGMGPLPEEIKTPADGITRKENDFRNVVDTARRAEGLKPLYH